MPIFYFLYVYIYIILSFSDILTHKICNFGKLNLASIVFSINSSLQSLLCMLCYCRDINLL